MKNRLNRDNGNTGKQFAVTVSVIFLLLTVMLVVTFLSFFESSVTRIEKVGKSSLAKEKAEIESYLNKGLNVLSVTADTVNYMMENNQSNEAILEYMSEQTIIQKDKMDPNFTGIYGYINGEYLDGSGWEPPSGYDSKKREWYITALDSKGEPVIVSPYLDAQTGTIMISISQLLSDNESVVSLDIELKQIQLITEDISLDGMGYGFIVDKSGLVVAHENADEKGKVYPLNDDQDKLLKGILEGKEAFEIALDGEKCTVFSDCIFDDWYVVLVVSNTRLFASIREQIIINSIVCLVIYVIIVAFCTVAYRKIMHHQKSAGESRKRLDDLNANVIKALAYTIDAKDRYTSGHSQRVANYSMEIAKRMGKSEEEQQIIYYAGLLHDVGKIRVPEDVINKPGKLTEDEFNQIKMHPVSGFHILKDIYDDKRIAYGAKYHHEHYDGSGYPTGLVGDNIPEFARIIGVADAYDAMASNRSYRNALPQKVVRDEIEKCSGKQFDPAIAKIMLELIDEDKEYKMCQTGSMKKNVLIVDDEKMNIRIVEFIFKDDEEYNVFSAKNGEDALRIIENNKVDIILLDILMPDINGFDLYKKIREKYDMPIVFSTADKNIETIQKAAELGLDDYIAKPFLPSILKETVHGIIHSWK